jgi:hypothetical protein
MPREDVGRDADALSPGVGWRRCRSTTDAGCEGITGTSALAGCPTLPLSRGKKQSGKAVPGPWGGYTLAVELPPRG